MRLGRGDGTFGTSTSYATESGVSNSITIGDLNGDGILDLTSAGLGDSGGLATVRLGRGDGTFGEITSFVPNQTKSVSVTLGDLAGDGVSDLINAGVVDSGAPLVDFSLKTKAGASQTRVTEAISNLQTARENFTAAESRIKDADIASDSANLTRTQIFQQAAAAVLAQSNLAPQLALRLLS